MLLSVLEAALTPDLGSLRPGLGFVPYLDTGDSFLPMPPDLRTPIARLRGNDRKPSAEIKHCSAFQ